MASDTVIDALFEFDGEAFHEAVTPESWVDGEESSNKDEDD